MSSFNMSKNRNPMPTLEPVSRKCSFDEVAVGYSEAVAIDEAMRCLNCKNMPCVSGCPVNVKIPEFIARVRDCDFEGAYNIISESSSLPAVCGRVCPQERQCEKMCVRGKNGESVGIGRLERFVADFHNAHAKDTVTKKAEPNGKRVAVVGSGPSGLACAGDLAKLGYGVSVFEALHALGGVLTYGIPEFRLPKAIVRQEIDNLRALGVEFETNVIIGKTLTVDDLFKMGYSAVFIGSGAGLPNFMGIPGETYNGVYSANEFLTRINLCGAYKPGSATPVKKGGKVAVVGGGNVAMDAARSALRLGAEKVYVVYRRSFDELPARREEIEHAMEEGIEFMFLSSPKEILGYKNENDPRDRKNGSVTGIRCVKMRLCDESDSRGRRTTEEIPGSEFDLAADTVIMAIGTTPNPLIKSTTDGLDVNGRGCILVNEVGATSRAGVYAGGDAVTGAATVISAMGAGKCAASAIDEFLKTSNHM